MKINNHNQPICIIYNYAQHYRLGIFRMIDQKNNNNLTPIDVINDIKISNYFQGLLFENLKNVKKGLKDLDHEISLKEHKIVNTLITLFIMVILQFLMFIYFMLFLIKKN